MNLVVRILEAIQNSYSNPIMPTSVILSVLLVVFIMSCYEFAVYRLVSHRAFYNKSFNICLAILPFFISTIILCLQSNIVITLGTIGALAIIRFRTAVKDPVDMLYLLWSVHIGITCGCQLYEVAILTSLAVTILLIALDRMNFGRKPFILVAQCSVDKSEMLMNTISKYSKSYRIKSQSITHNADSDSCNYVVELSTNEKQNLMQAIADSQIEKCTILEYDSDDII